MRIFLIKTGKISCKVGYNSYIASPKKE